MKETRLILVRHGQSLGNATRTMLGHTDLDLTELGHAQARVTADFLADEQIDVIYSSDLIRAMNTALPHAQIRGLTVNPSVGLREACVGVWENRTVDSIIEEYGEVFERDWHGKFGTFEFPGGESIQGACDRFYAETERIALMHPGKTVLIAAHAAVIRAFYARVMGIAPEDIVEKLPFPTNASYSVLTYSGDAFTPVEYSCDSHLVEVGITKVGT